MAGPAIDNMTLGELARREFHVITGILSHAFGGKHDRLEQQQQPYQIDFGQQQLIDPFQQLPVDEGQKLGLGGQ